MEINKKLIKYNQSIRNGTQIKYIVIHDTGNRSATATAEGHYQYFSGGNRNASAHYFVDEKEIIQIIEDDKSAWHVGDGKGKNGITNSNSIGIEICINDGNYLTEIGKTLELTKYLMQKHNIPIQNVVRHFDASGKMCPSIMKANNWLLWNDFKRSLEASLNTEEKVKVKINGRIYLMDGKFENDKNYVGIRELAVALGVSNEDITWNVEEKMVVIE